MPLGLSIFLRIILVIAGLGVSFLPRKLELRLGPWLGKILFYIDGTRRSIAYENIRRCLPELGPEGWQRLLKANYTHYGILALELLHLFSPLRGHYRSYAERIFCVEGLRNWRRETQKGRGVILISFHGGNWEMAAAAGAMCGIPLTMVTRRLKPEWLLKKVEASRLSVGTRAAYLPRTLSVALKALRRGESVGFVMDQYAPTPMGIPVKFFGVEVDTLAGIGPLAQRTGAAVVPVFPYRDVDGLIHVRFEPAMDFGPDRSDPKKVTEILANKVEHWIREKPEQWLWVHRRFKNVHWPKEFLY